MRFIFIFSTLLAIMITGSCSQGLNLNPVDPGLSQNSSDLPDTSYAGMDDFSSSGILDSYQLVFSPDYKTADLIINRNLNMGESYLVSGKAFFTKTPCSDCLKIKSISLYDVNGVIGVRLGMAIKHPFPKGNTSLPPSATNRLDLDVFDLALVVKPDSTSPATYPLTGADAYAGVMINADGYTRDLSKIIKDESALPYKICYESINNNRFAMGTDYQPFDVVFSPGPPPGLSFTLFLTMGYGWSAIKTTRLNPTYYIPEFNRKSAWKVIVDPPNSGSTWIAGDILTTHDVIIDIYDWNHGATVASTFPDPAHTDYIFSESDISSVTVEVPGMVNTLINASTTDTTTNGWDDAMTYTASFANENNLPAGEYPGLVKVLDSRVPQSETPLGYGWARNWNDNEYPSDVVMRVAMDSSGNCIVPGGFKGSVDFDPGPDLAVYTSDSPTATDGFVKKIDSEGNYLWAITFGNIDMSYALDAVTNDLDEIYVIGRGTNGAYLVKLDSNGTLLWSRSWNTSYIGVLIKDIDLDSTGNVYVTGGFYGSGDFDPGIGVSNQSTAGDSDCFVSCFDPDGTFIRVITWGGFGIDMAVGISISGAGNIYTTGTFTDMADFDPSIGDDLLMSYNEHPAPFISKLDSAGNYLWALTWGLETGNSVPSYLVTDASDNVYVTGNYSGLVDFDPGISQANLSSQYASYDCFLAKFDPAGSLIRAKSWGTQHYDMSLGLVYDNAGFLYAAGTYAESTNTAFLYNFLDDGNFGPFYSVWTGVASGIANDNNGSMVLTGSFNGTVDFNYTPGKDIHKAIGGTNRCIVKYVTRDGAYDGSRDSIVYTLDGITTQWRIVPEFATYQTFIALVE